MKFIIRRLDEIIRKDIRKNNPLRVFELVLLLFCIVIQTTRKTVGTISDSPPNPVTKLIANRSKAKEVIIVEIVKVGIAQIKNLKSFLKKGNTRKKIPKGIMKNWVPPQEDRENIRKIPPIINFVKAIL